MNRMSYALASFTLVGMCALSSAHAQDGWLLAHMTPVGGLHQKVPVGSMLPQRFAVKVTGDDGVGIPGISVTFANNTCIPPPLHPDPCPPHTLWGNFPVSVPTADATTDASGVAYAPAYTAGSTNGEYTVFVYMSWPQTIAGHIYWHQPGEQFPLFEIVQDDVTGGGVPAVVSAPTLGAYAMWLEGLLVLMLGAWGMRRARRRA